jgi:uncharacterized protein
MFPSRVADARAGRGLFATRELAHGTVVACFDGPVVAYREVPDHDVCHVLWIGPDAWMIPTTPARFINHSCAPNCAVVVTEDDRLTVATLGPVAAGAELTFDYAAVDDLDRDDPESFWDPRWTFACTCATVGCRGQIDRYVEAP